MDVRVRVLVSIVAAGAVAGCTTFGDSTKVGAATGGAMGAGLGAIIGSQTGDAVGGLALGAAAGAGSGAAIGNVLQAQQEAIQTQDEAIERQQQVIRSQAAQIEELRRLSQDSIQFDPSPSEFNATSSRSIDSAVREATLTFDDSSSRPAKKSPNKVIPFGQQNTKTEIVAQIPTQPDRLIPSRYGAIGEKVKDESQLRGNIQWDALPDRSTQEQRSVLPTLVDSKKLYQSHKSAALPVSDDCVAANEEAKKANGVTEVADKLFHNRRALRLCPESPALHHGLAAVYLELGRIEDAKFELEEALRLDPSYAPASISLKSLSAPATVVY